MEKQVSGARATLTRERVLEAAVALADAQGLDALSMRNLGEALGIKAMSLYNHVADKDDLLDGIADRVVGEIALPPAGTPWREALRQRAHAANAVLMKHPWATALLMSRMNIGPNMLRYVDWTLGCLLEAGFSYQAADRAWNTLDSHIYGYTLQRLNFPLEVAQYREAAAGYLPSLSEERYPYMRRLTREVAEGRHDGLQDLDFGLDLILDGLERLLARAQT